MYDTHQNAEMTEGLEENDNSNIEASDFDIDEYIEMQREEFRKEWNEYIGYNSEEDWVLDPQ